MLIKTVVQMYAISLVCLGYFVCLLLTRVDATSSPPSFKPSTAPSFKPTVIPPTRKPTLSPPTASPTAFPSSQPTVSPTTPAPTSRPTPKPSPVPTAVPTYPTQPLPTSHNEEAYIVAYVGSIYSILLILCVLIIKNYAEPNFPWFSYISLTIGYFSSFGILLLVPIDIANAVASRRTMDITGLQYFPNTKLLSTLYSVLFNTILFMGSLWLCVEEYYHADGYFNPFYRILSSLYKFFRDTFAMIVLGIIILIILIVKHVVNGDANALSLTAKITTNIMYETFLVFLLGYGLIEYPRSFWNCANLDYYLKQTEMKASSAFKAVHDCKLDISLEVGNVLKTKEQLAAYGSQDLNDAMDILHSEMPKNQYGQFEFKSSKMGEVAVNKSGQITITSLADLRYRLKVARDQYKMSQLISEQTNILAYNLEDIVRARASDEKVIYWSLRGTPSTLREYMWYVSYRPLFWRLCAVFSGSLSILSFIGVCCSMYGVDPQKSPYFLAVHADSSTVGAVVVFIFITFGYTVYATMWALFQMRFAGLMNLVPGQTAPEALSFNVRMVARLAAPLAFFYLGWIAENGLNNGTWTWNRAPDSYYIYRSYSNPSHVFHNSSWVPLPGSNYTDDGVIVIDSTDNKVYMPSAFSDFYNLQSVSAIKQSFGTIFPVLLFIVVALIGPNLLNRLLVLAKMQNYQFGTEIATEEELAEGRKQLERFKKLTVSNFRKKTFRGVLAGFSGSDDSGIWGWLMGATSTVAHDDDQKSNRRLSTVMAAQLPENLSSLVQKLGTAGFSFTFTSGWNPQWARIIDSDSPPSVPPTSPPIFLAFYKRQADPSSDAAATPDKKCDVSLIMSIYVVDKEVKDEIHVDFGEEIIKIKLPNQQEAEKWKTQLLKWKDFAIDLASTPSSSLLQHGNDIEYQKISQINSLDDIVFDDLKNSGDSPINRDVIMKGAATFVEPLEKPKSAGYHSFNPFSRAKKDSADAVEMAPSKPVVIANPKPLTLEGKIQKKIEHSHNPFHVGDVFHDRFMKIDDKGKLMIIKSAKGGDSKDITIDLKEVSSISAYVKGGKEDPLRFNIDASEQIYKLKADTAAECQKWMKALNEWKDYLLMEVH